MECLLWTVGVLPEPKYSACRIELAKTVAILLVIDDIYDTHGTLDELVLFTDAIRRFIYIFFSFLCVSSNLFKFLTLIRFNKCLKFRIHRWDLEAIEDLPKYMKICYMALYNTTNEICYKVLKENGWSVLPYLKATVNCLVIHTCLMVYTDPTQSGSSRI